MAKRQNQRHYQTALEGKKGLLASWPMGKCGVMLHMARGSGVLQGARWLQSRES